MGTLDSAYGVTFTALDREKLNGSTDWIRTEIDLLIDGPYSRVDVFPSIDNVEITLPDPASLSSPASAHDVFNQSDRENNVLLKDHTSATIAEIFPGSGYSAFFNPDVAAWELVQIEGRVVPTITASEFGDFDSGAWAPVRPNVFSVFGVGSEYSNLPFTPEGATEYEILVDINESSDYYTQRCLVATTDSAANALHFWRAGTDRADAIANGWEVASTTSAFRFQVALSNDSTLIAGAFMKLGTVTTTATSGFVPHQSLTLESVSICRSDADNADVEILVNGSVEATVNTAALCVVDSSMSVSVSASDVISARNKAGSNTMEDVICSLWFEGVI